MRCRALSTIFCYFDMVSQLLFSVVQNRLPIINAYRGKTIGSLFWNTLYYNWMASPDRKLVLSEGSDGIIQLRGVSLHKPTCAEELLEMLVTGNKERTQSPTAANEESSRSHAIFQIYLRGRPKVSGTTNTWKHAKFSLIDLAGYLVIRDERSFKSGTRFYFFSI